MASRSSQEAISFAALLAVTVPVEMACAGLAYHTVGEIVSRLLFIAVGLNAIPALLFLRRRPVLSTILVLAIAAAIVPYQGMLGHRLIVLQDEAGQIVRYVGGAKRETGEYPTDLSGYSYRDPSLREHFHEYQPDDSAGGYRLSWFVGTPQTSHSYSPRDGWSYYPD